MAPAQMACYLGVNKKQVERWGTWRDSEAILISIVNSNIGTLQSVSAGSDLEQNSELSIGRFTESSSHAT